MSAARPTSNAARARSRQRELERADARSGGRPIAVAWRPALRVLGFGLPLAAYVMAALLPAAPGWEFLAKDRTEGFAAAPLIAVVFGALHVAYRPLAGRRLANRRRTALVNFDQTLAGVAAKWSPLGAPFVLPLIANTLALTLALTAVSAVALALVLELHVQHLRRGIHLRPDHSREMARFRWDALVAGTAVLAGAAIYSAWHFDRPTEGLATLGVGLPLLAMAPYFHAIKAARVGGTLDEIGPRMFFTLLLMPAQVPLAVLGYTRDGRWAFAAGLALAAAIAFVAEFVRRQARRSATPGG